MSSNEYEEVDFELYRYTPSLVAAIISLFCLPLRLPIIFTKSSVHDSGTLPSSFSEEPVSLAGLIQVLQPFRWFARGLEHS